MSSTEEKRIDELTIEDFRLHSVWTWVDAGSESSLVEPIDADGAWPNGDDAIFVGTQFTLSDGSQMEGDISIRKRDHKIYVITLRKTDTRFCTYPLQPLFKRKHPRIRKEIAEWLGKPISDVFPLAFETYCTFNGKPVMGVLKAEPTGLQRLGLFLSRLWSRRDNSPKA